MIGLSEKQALSKLEQVGPNRLPDKDAPSVIAIFFRQFKSPFIYVLMAAAAVSFGMQHTVNGIFILFVLLLNAAIGTFQEYSAARAANALKRMVPSETSVFRDGQLTRRLTTELVPGDRVQLISGDKVPADLKLAIGTDLVLDESLLTGESTPVIKGTDNAEQTATLYAGTMLNRGRCEGDVIATGINTEIGTIAKDVTSAEDLKPPLLQRMERFTLRITYGVGIVALLLVIHSLAMGKELADTFLLSVALAVSAIPEGLPAAITIALAIGMSRMSKKHVIVRRLLAVESLGSCTYIASDKTGTLTVNELTIQHLYMSHGPDFFISGEGLDPHGEIEPQPELVLDHSFIRDIASVCACANEARLVADEGEWQGQGDHVDLAFLVLCHKLGLDPEALRQQQPELAVLPYESENGFCASIRHRDGANHLYLKGSLQTLMAMCTKQADDKALNTQALLAKEKALASKGYRVLALACRAIDTESLNIANELHDLRLLAIVAMQDPLRPEAKQAVKACRDANIKVAMVTGDHPITASSIADQLGLEGSSTAMTGEDLQKELSQPCKQITHQCRVFARVTPHQKKLLVDELTESGEFVAVTGDGVNDAPALQSAHVGVAMGKRGTDVARESADLIITDDNFSSIVEGVKQGRVVYNNIRKVIFLLISTGAAEITLFTLSVLSGLPLPLLPIQLLWLNLVTNGIQDVALAFEPEEGDELSQPPRRPGEPIFNRVMVERVIIHAIVMGALAFLVFYLQIQAGMSESTARNLTLMQMVLFENVHVLNSRSEYKSVFGMPLFGNPFLLFGMLGAQMVHIAAIYTPGLNQVLELQPVSLEQWLSLLGLALTLIVAGEMHKWWRRKFGPLAEKLS